MLAGCLVLASGCSKNALPPTGGATGLPGAGSGGGDVISTFKLEGHTDAGRKKWEVQGETADLMSDTVQLSPVRAISYGQVQINLSSQTGFFNKKSQNVHLEGDVVVVTSDGGTLTTQRMDWYQDRQIAHTQDWVRVDRPGLVAVGLGGSGRPKVKQVRLERQVTVTLQDPKGKTVITCDGPLEVDYGRHKARFWRRVKVVDSNGVIRSDRLDVDFHPETNRMEKAVFWGHVQIDHGEQKAYANRVNYFQPLGRIQLVGHPRLLLQAESLE